MAAAAQARELEDTLAENAYALDQKRQSTTGHSLSSHPSYMNTVPRTTSMGIPIAESTPVPQIGPMLYRPTPTPRVRDIIEPSANEGARAKYLERQMRHISKVYIYHLQRINLLKKKVFLEEYKSIVLAYMNIANMKKRHIM